MSWIDWPEHPVKSEAQAIAFCTRFADPANPRESLRPIEAKPRVLERSYDSAVRSVLAARMQLLRRAKPEAQVPTDQERSSGRLLVYFPEENLACGTAECLSKGYFDVDNTPPWATWITLIPDTEDAENPGLIAWVPPGLVHHAVAGIDANPEECIRWPSDCSSSFRLAWQRAASV